MSPRLNAAALGLVPAILIPAAALAECGGPSLIDRLAPEDRAELASAAQSTPFGQGTMWEASRDDAVVYLVGTLHVWDPRMDPLAETAGQYLAGADHAMFEMTRTEQGQLMEAIAADPSLTVIMDGPTLPELLDAATWAAVSDAAGAAGIPSFMAAKMQPWFLATSLSMPACAMELMVGGRLGLDFQLMERAEQASIPMTALEPYDTLFGIFEQLTMEDQIDLLRLSLIAPELQTEMFTAMLDTYFAGEIGQIWELNRVAMDLMPDMVEEGARFTALTEEFLLVQRNHDWIPVIEEASNRYPVLFVAAGAAHMPGEDGVLKLLADRGWAITRLH